jgi:hypothetical protein
MKTYQFLEIIDNQTTDFRDHVDRVQNQYSEMRKLRENLPENEIVLWMDFADRVHHKGACRDPTLDNST